MAKTIKSLLRISLAIRNLGCLTNYTMTKRFIRTSIHCSTNYDKETLISPRPHLVSGNVSSVSSGLVEGLRSSKTYAQIFKLIQKKQDTMSANDVIMVLKTLLNISKIKSDKSEKLYEYEEFVTLCEILKRKIRFLDADQATNALKILTYFEVPSTSIIIQMLLQIISKSVNQLSLQKISFLDFLLRKCENTPLVGALRIALPIVYENNVITKLDRENIVSIMNATSYMCPVSKNTEVLNVILHALRKCPQPLDHSSAMIILRSLCYLQCYPENLPETLNHVQNVLAGGIPHIERQEIIKLLGRIADKIKSRETHFYHEGLLDACASTVISEDWGFTMAIEVLNKLILIGYTQISLLDYIAGKCFENRELLDTCPPASIATLINGFSVADYKPVFWDIIQEYIMSEKIIETMTINYPLPKLAISLLSLDCYCPKLLEKIFDRVSSEVAHRYIQKGRLLLLYQAVTTLYPQYTGPLPANPSDLIRPRIMDFPFLPYLESAVGGSRYVLTRLSTKLGHDIDHALVMRKGGFPIAINNAPPVENNGHTLLSLEDLNPPPDSQVILILKIPAHAYSTNTQRMKGHWSLQIKTLEALSGYIVIPISSCMWINLMETEKIPYLMQAIRLKCDEISTFANS